MKVRTSRDRIKPRVPAKAEHLDTLQHGENTSDFGKKHHRALVVMDFWSDPGERTLLGLVAQPST